MASARIPGWVWVVPPGAHSHFAPIAPDSGPSFCRAAPRAPQSSGGHPFFILAASPYSQLPGVGSGQVVRAHERRRKGVGSWSAPSCDLGPPSLSLTLPATYGSSPLRSSPSTPITSTPVALLWIRVTGEGSECRVLGSSPKDLIQEVTQWGLGI